MSTWRPIFQILLTSLVAGLLAVIIVLGLLFIESRSQRILSPRKLKLLLAFLVLSIIGMPAILSFFKGAGLSPEGLAVCVRELLASIVIVVSFSVTWKILDRPTVILGPVAKAYASAKQALHRPGTQNDALQAWDRGEIPKEAVERIQLMDSLKKLIEEQDDIGWYELQEEIGPSHRLEDPKIRLMVERALQSQPSRNGVYRMRLNSLLSGQLMENHHAT